MYIRWIIASIPIYKFLTNAIRYYQVNQYRSRYIDWVFHDKNVNFDISKDKAIVKRLIFEAGVSDEKILLEPEIIGDNIRQVNITSLLSRYPSNSEKAVPRMMGMFGEALGVYKLRCLETINPLYWIKFFIYLPKNLFSYLGIKRHIIIVNLLQLIWWFASISITVLWVTYKEQLKTFVNSVVEHLFK